MQTLRPLQSNSSGKDRQQAGGESRLAMQQMIGLSNPAARAMSLICILAVGFMTRFLVALVLEMERTRAHSASRLKTRRPACAIPEPLREALSTRAPRFSQSGVDLDRDSVHPVGTLEIVGKW